MPPITGLLFSGLALSELVAKKKRDANNSDDESQWSGSDAGEEGHEEYATAKPGDIAAASEYPKATIVSDARLTALKQQGHTDTAVAERLTKEGHKILAKTVASRWRKIREKLEQEADEKLDDDLSDWHEGDDGLLQKAYNAADVKFNKELEKLEEARWKTVRIQLAASLNKNKYTATACKERWNALQKGTAECPFEDDSDQEGRAQRRDARIAENKRFRAEAKANAAFAAAEKQRARDEDHARKIEHRRQVLEYKERRKAEKEEDALLRKEAAAGRLAERNQKLRAIQRVRNEIATKKSIKVQEDHVYEYYTGRNLLRKKRSQHKTGRAIDSEDDDNTQEIFNHEDDDGATSLAADSVLEGDEEEIFVKAPLDTPAIVTKATLTSPRSIMSLDELDGLLHERRLKRSPVEDHPEIVARLCGADRLLKSAEINNLLARHFLRMKGNMQMRIAALQQADAKDSDAGKRGWDVDHPEFKKGYEGYKGKYAHLLDA